MALTSIEVCAGAGGQALGLEQAGFGHLACVEYDRHAVGTLRVNRPDWNPVEADLTDWSFPDATPVDLLAGGVPCPPFSKAGKQLGADDERDLFPAMLRLVEELSPRAVMIENVRGLLDARFADYRQGVLGRLHELGFDGEWRLLTASDFGVAQLRPRSILVAFRGGLLSEFKWPDPVTPDALSVGDILGPLMAEGGWEGADGWAASARGVAPTLVGGSKKHGGADLGPTRARREWAERHGVDGRGLANEPPQPGFVGMPRLTVKMTAVLQGFPAEWQFAGGKTAQYRQVGNAFPPPVARAVGQQIAAVLTA
ncbi:MAG: DNA cytosine methyltransferase [Candidatus Nanopelagicales bacterium]